MKITLTEQEQEPNLIIVARDMSEAHAFMVLACLADKAIHTYKGFPTRESAWDAVESVCAVKRPHPKPTQLMWDNCLNPFINKL